MTPVTCRLTAEYQDQLRNPTLGNRVRASFLLGTDRLGNVSKAGCQWSADAWRRWLCGAIDRRFVSWVVARSVAVRPAAREKSPPDSIRLSDPPPRPRLRK